MIELIAAILTIVSIIWGFLSDILHYKNKKKNIQKQALKTYNKQYKKSVKDDQDLRSNEDFIAIQISTSQKYTKNYSKMKQEYYRKWFSVFSFVIVVALGFRHVGIFAPEERFDLQLYVFIIAIIIDLLLLYGFIIFLLSVLFFIKKPIYHILKFPEEVFLLDSISKKIILLLTPIFGLISACLAIWFYLSPHAKLFTIAWFTNIKYAPIAIPFAFLIGYLIFVICRYFVQLVLANTIYNLQKSLLYFGALILLSILLFCLSFFFDQPKSFVFVQELAIEKIQVVLDRIALTIKKIFQSAIGS